jgi:hypothetical protein
MLAKWQAIPEPIIPDPITATFDCAFHTLFLFVLLEYAFTFYLFTVKKVAYMLLLFNL